MTISSETNRSGPYNGNGVTTAFDYDFKVEDESHVRVIRADAGGVETTLDLNSDYAVTGVGNNEGGQVVLADALPAGETLTLIINVPFLQETDLENQGAYYAETVEAALDRAVQRDLQLKEQLDRAVKIPASSDPGQLDELIPNIVRLSASAGNIDTVAGIAGAVDDVADNVASITAVAANLADVTNFADLYLGPHADEPTTRNDGSPLQAGDMYFRLAPPEMRAYDGTDWRPVTTLSLGGVRQGDIVAEAAQTVFEVDGEFTYVTVFLNGIRLVPTADFTVDSPEITLVEAAAAGDVLSYLAYYETAADAYYVSYDGDAGGDNVGDALDNLADGKANLAGGNAFSGNQSIAGTLTIGGYGAWHAGNLDPADYATLDYLTGNYPTLTQLGSNYPTFGWVGSNFASIASAITSMRLVSAGSFWSNFDGLYIPANTVISAVGYGENPSGGADTFCTYKYIQYYINGSWYTAAG